ncbi:MAG: phytanoyl-CoA dioxygenase family protein [Fimbriimonas sp.]|nr:phytanoyl-CoA dioxygenase family protein [Fimbriimonas sp.]
MSIIAKEDPWLTLEPYKVSVDEYRSFRRDGYLIVRNLVTPEHVEDMLRHTEDLIYGRIEVPGAEPFDPDASLKEIENRLLRIHMLHTHLEIWERYLLYPRVLDVVQALHGPDIAAMQTMMFIKGPGAFGQGFHQDTYYIPTFPDTLIGAWIALDRADTENGCLWMSPGSHSEPIYPPTTGYGYGDWGLGGMKTVANVGAHSNDDDNSINELKPIAAKYADREAPAVLEPGDVAFFGGHVLHRSLMNRSEDRMRRSFVNHYCNARSYTSWGGGNKCHILARGNTHLEYGQPKFGTPCAANSRERTSISDSPLTPPMMMATPEGTMAPQTPAEVPHDD